MAGDIIVLKFGSSVLRTPRDLPTAVHEIYRWYRSGWRVVTVVSAIGDTTDTLLATARLISTNAKPQATAELLATGERHSAAMLGLALDQVGVPSRVVDPRDIHLAVEGTELDSDPTAVDHERIEAWLQQYGVIVVPGFFGYTAQGQLHLLGRGGSDLTAVFLAHALHANRCRLIKDVDGVYETDPATSSTGARRFVALSYADALACAAPLIQPKAVRYLERHAASAEIAGLLSPYESLLGPFSRTLTEPRPAAPLSVLLLGLGTVGLGVYQRLAAVPNHFHVVGAFVRDRMKHITSGIPPHLLHDSIETLTTVHADLLVDALPDPGLSHTLVEQSLMRGTSVVSANKALIAEAGLDLARLAHRHDGRLLYAAAVGGSAPMLETLGRGRHRGPIRCIAGILNGTCNYILDRCAEGRFFHEATRLAHEHGFAEADATEDLSGRDAARKLRILVRHAFGKELSGLGTEPLNAATFLRARTSLSPGESLRCVARAWQLGSRVLGQIQLEALPAHDPFAQTREEWNRLVITYAEGEDVAVCGRGAGRWPTAEAVIADLLELRFARYAATAHA